MFMRKIIALTLGIHQANAFYFLCEEDYNDSSRRAYEHIWSDNVQLIALPSDQGKGFVYATATAISPTVILTAGHVVDAIQQRGGKSLFWNENKRSWVPLIRFSRAPVRTPCPLTHYPDDIGVAQLETPLHLSKYPVLPDSVQPNLSGVCIGYGSVNWSGRGYADTYKKTQVNFKFKSDPRGCYRHHFFTSDVEGAKTVREFKHQDTEITTKPAFGLPGDSGAPVFDADGRLAAVYVKNIFYTSRIDEIFQPNQKFSDMSIPVSTQNPWLRETLTDYGYQFSTSSCTPTLVSSSKPTMNPSEPPKPTIDLSELKSALSRKLTISKTT